MILSNLALTRVTVAEWKCDGRVAAAQPVRAVQKGGRRRCLGVKQAAFSFSFLWEFTQLTMIL